MLSVMCKGGRNPSAINLSVDRSGRRQREGSMNGEMIQQQREVKRGKSLTWELILRRLLARASHIGLARCESFVNRRTLMFHNGWARLTDRHYTG